jgi:son of sevenless-like protein
MKLVKQTFEGLLSVGHEQADVAQGDYNGSIEWRMSRLSVINDHFGGALHASTSTDPYYENEDVVDMELAFSSSGTKKADTYDSYRTLANPPNVPDTPATVPTRDLEVSSDSNIVSTPSKDSQVASDRGGSQCDDSKALSYLQYDPSNS